MKKRFLPALLMLILTACVPEPQAIEYGSDVCDFCKMSIVDKQYAAELVTTKGKVFKFDAIECMLNYKKANGTISFALQLVNTYEFPGELKTAESSFYLISKQLPSPMGAYLTAFADESTVNQMHENKGGTRLSWQELEQEFNENGIQQLSLH